MCRTGNGTAGKFGDFLCTAPLFSLMEEGIKKM